MQQQWSHQDGASRDGDTRYRWPLTPVGKLGIGQPAINMRGGQDLQRPVLIGAVVDLEPHGYHLLEHVDGRVNMCDALLDGPTGKTGRIQSSQNRDGYILMPSDGPVCARFFIEQNCPRETRFTCEKFFRQFEYAIRPEQLTDAWRSPEHIPYVGAVALECVEHGADLLNCVRRENIIDDQKAVASELLMLSGIEAHDRR